MLAASATFEAMALRLRPITQREADVCFLRRMLYEAAACRPGSPLPDQVLSNPDVARYVESWGQQGDTGLVAEDEAGRALGAAWYRLFTEDEHGYGFIDPSIPELTIAVEPNVRGRGVGAALLAALIERAHADGLPALSLSVEQDNPAIRLYERAGFTRVRQVEDAWTMRLDL